MKAAALILMGLALAGISDTPHRDMRAVLSPFLNMTAAVQADAELMQVLGVAAESAASTDTTAARGRGS